MQDWLRQNPQIHSIRVAASDLNGQARGKRVPARFAKRVIQSGTRFPMSVLNLDIWGKDIEDSPLVFETGDRDAVLMPTERGFVPMPWLNAPSALLPLWMFHEDGRPYAGDPRHALREVLERFKMNGLTPMCAVELEFFLIDDAGDTLDIPEAPTSGKRNQTAETMSIRALDQFDAFFTELYAACDEMGIPADTAISESGMGQFEINLEHCDDALRAADDAWLFKMLVKGVARRHGFAASFMAKPYPDASGSGMHTHFSVLDSDGRNVFDDGTEKGTNVLQHAISGCLTAMAECGLIFAPHANSYDRMVPGSHAPTGICWAYENRTAALRVPSGSPTARRIEHRVAGGDVNPYLMLAAVLGSALNGIEDGHMPPAPITGNAYDASLAQVPGDWKNAIDAFVAGTEVARIFSPELIRNFVLTKRQERRFMAELSREDQISLYLETV
ncbi:MAG: glutamine synthetase family protein [Pseudomonadota bacterium]